MVVVVLGMEGREEEEGTVAGVMEQDVWLDLQPWVNAMKQQTGAPMYIHLYVWCVCVLQVTVSPCSLEVYQHK